MANQVDGQSVGRMVAITPSNTARFNSTIGLTASADGTVSVLCVNNTKPIIGADTPVTITMTAGVLYPIRAIAVYATGTTATGIVALYQD